MRPGVRPRRRWWPAGMLLLWAAGLALLPLSRAAAHAELDRAEPAPGAALAEAPTRARLWFTERVEPRFTTVRVLSAGAVRADSGEAEVDPQEPRSVGVALGPLEEGSYTVA